jgi:hypothetical protein
VADAPDDETRTAAVHIAERVMREYPEATVRTHDSRIGPFVVVELYPANPNQSRPVTVTVFHNGSYQVEIFPIFEAADDTPTPFERTVENATAAILEVVSDGVPGSFGVKGYPSWGPASGT